MRGLRIGADRRPKAAPQGCAARRRGLALAVLLALAASAPPVRAQGGAAALDVRFGPEADYGPFVYAGTDGRVHGLSVDLLDLVAQQSGLRIQTLPPRPLKELLDMARKGDVDLISSLRPTPERAAFLAFSRPYVAVPAVVVVPAQGPLSTATGRALWLLLERRPVAVGAGYAVEPHLRQTRPEVDWRAVPDDVVALRGVREGRYVAAVVDLASLAFVMQHHGIDGLVARDNVGFDYSLSFGVRKDRPDLLERIDAGLRALPQAERSAVLARWMQPLDLSHRPPGAGALRGLLVALVVAGLLIAGYGLWRTRRSVGRST